MEQQPSQSRRESPSPQSNALSPVPYRKGGHSLKNDHSSVPEGSTSGHKPKPPDKDSIRWFLVRAVILLMFVDLIVYLIVRDNGVLLVSTLIGVAVTSVFGYYFSNRQ